MLHIELQSLHQESPTPHTSKDNPSWVEWRALDLYDQDLRQKVADWFYVAACSPKYLADNDATLTDHEKQLMVVTDQFSEPELLDTARERFNALSFTDWDDFYAKMAKAFVHED
ncbi:MAG TPA: hypothetical protein VLI54_00905 [Bacillota bacterium]|nr:hypothetical protein [Bacillota bacterium]